MEQFLNNNFGGIVTAIISLIAVIYAYAKLGGKVDNHDGRLITVELDLKAHTSDIRKHVDPERDAEWRAEQRDRLERIEDKLDNLQK